MHFHYRKQFRDKGIYATLELEVAYLPYGENGLMCDYSGPSKWENVCKGGATLFFDYFNRKNKGTLKVAIKDVQEFPLSTNQLIVMFATVRALCDCLNYDVAGLEFDAETAAFSFPEVRSLL